jgi:molybdopterin molybdotransferase
VPLLSALGRVLVADLFARIELPEFDNSAMDGYAVRHADLVVGRSLPIAQEIRAGDGSPAALAPGYAARIFTGAPMPPRADTVVMQENADRDEREVRFRELPDRNAHVRARGSDVRIGDRLVQAGRAIGPGEIGILAAQGCSRVDVHRRPRVAILPTGDELRELDEPARAGSLVNSNAYALAAAVQQAGGEAWILPIARDRLEEITARIEQGLQADLLLTVGGVSVGDYDFVARALTDVGVALHFHKVTVKPGKPILFGKRANTAVIGLPGNPISALVTFQLFVQPCLRRLLGHLAPFQESIEVVLGRPYRHSPGRTELVRATLAREAGELRATLHQRQGSASLPSMVGQDALVILPAERETFAAGERLWALRLAEPGATEPPFR